MDKELEQYWADVRSMMETDGWRKVLKDLSDQYEVINSLDATQTVEDMWFRKGQLNVLHAILNLESSIDSSETAHKQNLEDYGSMQ